MGQLEAFEGIALIMPYFLARRRFPLLLADIAEGPLGPAQPRRELAGLGLLGARLQGGRRLGNVADLKVAHSPVILTEIHLIVRRFSGLQSS